MATAEAAAAAAALGPRYAPEDPSLPKPWKGLIDGSTGLMYYWNPETNVTQYEKPATLPPPLPPGPPPAVSTPKLAPIPVGHMVQHNGVVAQMGQKQVSQDAQQQGQQMSLLAQQQGQVIGQPQGSMVVQVSDQKVSQHPSSQMGQRIQQPGQFIPQQNRPQIMQHPDQKMMSQMGQQMPQQPIQHMPQHQGQQPGQPMSQPAIHQMPQQLGQQTMQHQNSQMAQPQGHQYTHQHLQYMAYQQSVLPQGQQSSQQPTPHGAEGQQYPNQEDYKAAVPKREDVDFKLANQTGFSPSKFQQMGTSSSQNLSAGTNSVQMPQTGLHLGQAQQFTGSTINMQQPTPMAHSQQSAADLVHQQQGRRFQNQMGPSIMQSNMPTPSVNTSYEDNLHGRAGNDYYFNGSKDGSMMGPHQPSLSAIPMEMRVSGLPPQNIIPGHGGGFNAMAGHAMHNMYDHAAPPYSNNALMRPSFVGSADTANLSPAEAYCKQHEVTATGDNVPAPFIRFEDTGFPPEILREVRYLLQRSICRTLHCYWYTYKCNNYSHFWRLQNGQLEPFLCIF